MKLNKAGMVFSIISALGLLTTSVRSSSESGALKRELEQWSPVDLAKISCALNANGYRISIFSNSTNQLVSAMLAFYAKHPGIVEHTRASLLSERGRYYFVWGFLDPEYGYEAIRPHIKSCSGFDVQ